MSVNVREKPRVAARRGREKQKNKKATAVPREKNRGMRVRVKRDAHRRVP